MGARRTAVVLFQLGGPDSLEAVGPFLFNLFMDPDIINFPLARLARKPLARYISKRRSKYVAQHYSEIGGKSPILDLTMAQAKALEKELKAGMDAQVFVAMRYWHPLTDTVAEEVKKGGFDEIILLPLYPQCSITTSGSSLNEWHRQCSRVGLTGVPQRLVHHYYDNPKYIEAIVDRVNASLLRLEDTASTHILFSAHGLPLSVIKRGDPYQRHIEETVRLVRERGGWKNPATLCYQSKVGPAKWLEPSLHETIHELGTSGVKGVLVVPIAFVTEHIETLHEINIEEREEAEKSGITNFSLMPALNDHPRFIEALADEVIKRTTDDERPDDRLCVCRAVMKKWGAN